MATHINKYATIQNNPTYSINAGSCNTNGYNLTGSLFNYNNFYNNSCYGYTNYNCCNTYSAKNMFLSYFGMGLGNMCANLCSTAFGWLTNLVGSAINGGGDGGSDKADETSSKNPEVTRLNEKIEANLKELGITKFADIDVDSDAKIEDLDYFDDYKEEKASLEKTIAKYDEKGTFEFCGESYTNATLAGATVSDFDDVIKEAAGDDAGKKATLTSQIRTAIEDQKELKEAAEKAQTELDKLNIQHDKEVRLIQRANQWAKERDAIEEKEETEVDTSSERTDYNDLFTKDANNKNKLGNVEVTAQHIKDALKDFTNATTDEAKTELGEKIELLVERFGKEAIKKELNGTERKTLELVEKFLKPEEAAQ